MPYINKLSRSFIYDNGKIDVTQIQTAGDLQFAMAVMFKYYIRRKGLNYQHCNDIMGALAGAQMEFYRRTVAPYEDEKIEKNGDV